MQSTKPSTNPFVYVIAAAVIAGLSFGVHYVMTSLEENEAVIQSEEAQVTNYLKPRDASKKVESTGTAMSGTTEAGTTPTTTSGAK